MRLKLETRIALRRLMIIGLDLLALYEIWYRDNFEFGFLIMVHSFLVLMMNKLDSIEHTLMQIRIDDKVRVCTKK